MKVLLIRAGGLGDTALCLFAAQWLSSALGHSVTVMVQRRHIQLAGLFGFDAVSEEECDFQSAYSTPSSRLVSALKPFDAVIAIKKETGNLGGGVNGMLELIAPLPPADCALPYPMFVIHGVADALGVDPPDALPRLEPKIKWAKPLLSHLVFAIGSGSLTKNWPLDNFIKLIEIARANGFEKFTSIIGPAEMERDPGAVKSLSPINGVCALIAPSLHDLADEIAGASVFVGADSGVTHLASLIGTPTIALFGPSDPLVWRPVGDRVTVIRAPSGQMDDITVESVIVGATRWVARFETGDLRQSPLQGALPPPASPGSPDPGLNLAKRNRGQATTGKRI